MPLLLGPQPKKGRNWVIAPQPHKERNWIIARTEPKKEKVARKALRAKGFEVYLPKVKDRKRPKGQRVIYLFANYIFIYFTEHWTKISDVDFIVDLLRPNRPKTRDLTEDLKEDEIVYPFKLEDEFIEELKKPEKGGFVAIEDDALRMLIEALPRAVKISCKKKREPA